MLLDPARGNNFFGRSELLELLKKRADGLRSGYRQNIAIIGPSYCGKTSVICSFIDNLSFNDVIPVYIEVKLHGFPNFAEKFISTLLFKYLINADCKIEDTEELMPVASERMPKTVKAIKAIEALIKAGKMPQAYSAIFELPSTAYAETSLRPIIILDEFHRIENFGIDNAFAILGKYIMVQKDTMYIVTSSQINQAREILSEKLSLLFGNFETWEMETFDPSTAVDFINFRLRVNTLPRQFINFLVAFTGGHPFYLDSILLNLDDNLSAAPKDNQVEAITKTFAGILFDSKGILNQHFVNVAAELEKQDELYIPVLLAAANGKKKVQSISAATRIRARELRPLLDRLIDFGWVANYGVFYLIRDKVFEFWLRNVHQNKEYLLDLGFEPKISKFNMEIKEFLNKYAEASDLDYIQRISGLFMSFGGELVEINKRSFKFPGFKTVNVMHKGASGVSYLLLSNASCVWVFLVGLTPLKESDISDFLIYCKQHKGAVKRKVIISPSEMDANTKLLAKEAKTWIWTLKELNELADISEKQRMVLFNLSGIASQETAAGCMDKLETAQ